MLIELDPMVSPSLGDAGNTLHILTETVVKHLFDLVQVSSSLGDLHTHKLSKSTLIIDGFPFHDCLPTTRKM